MSRHRMDVTRDQLRVPPLTRRYLIQHPGRLSERAVQKARGVAALTGRTDAADIPAVITRATAPLATVTA